VSPQLPKRHSVVIPTRVELNNLGVRERTASDHRAPLNSREVGGKACVSGGVSESDARTDVSHANLHEVSIVVKLHKHKWECFTCCLSSITSSARRSCFARASTTRAAMANHGPFTGVPRHHERVRGRQTARQHGSKLNWRCAGLALAFRRRDLF
jgi:hypothetical protein